MWRSGEKQMARPNWDGIAEATMLLQEVLEEKGLTAAVESRVRKAIGILSLKVDGAMPREEFRELRKKLGRTQEDLASDLGKRTRTISRYESGDVPIPAAVAQALRDLVGDP